MTDISREQSVCRITWIGMIVNIILSLLKVSAGVYGKSQAVLADGIHSISDLAGDLMILIGVRYWSEPPDENHPHGHRRIETIVTLGIGIILMLTALGLGLNAVKSLMGTPQQPGFIAIIAAAVSFLSKEVLFHVTRHQGRKCGSSAVIANAWHHRSDAFSSLPVLIAVIVIRLQPAWRFLDPLAAIAVVIFVFHAAVNIMKPSAGKLIDAAAPREIVDSIRDVAGAVPHVQDVHKIRTRYIGDNAISVDLHIEVDGAMSVQEGHDVSTRVKDTLIASEPEIHDVVVHLEPHSGKPSETL